MMVSDDMPVESTPLSTVTCGAGPPGRTLDSHVDSTAGSVVTSRLERWSRSTWSSTGSLGKSVPPFFETIRVNYDTVGSVMKANPPSVDKASGAGRPRDPRIDAAILMAT